MFKHKFFRMKYGKPNWFTPGNSVKLVRKHGYG